VATLAAPDAMIFYQRHPGPQADLDVQRIQDVMVDLCENHKDRFALLDLPQTKDIDFVRRWRRRVNSSYAAFYYPWLTLGTPGPNAQKIPPSGFIAGVMARVDTDHGAFKAPANEVIHNVGGLTVSLLDNDIGHLNADGINTLRSVPGRGIRIWGARTTSDDPSWRYVNVRRLFIMLRRSVQAGTQWAVFEPNSHALWDSIVSTVGYFLEDQWKRGAFVGDSPEEAFFVKCDEETNPADVRDRGQMIIEIGVAPALPAEFIIFDVVQVMGDQAEEAR
jgi:hypothetical protein